MRQYVGARYMPKFMGTYDATTAYEALSVVDNGMGTSYISNKPTPAGIPLNNTAYWAIYGASNGAIINLQNQINNLTDNIIPSIADINKAINEDKWLFIWDSYGMEPTPATSASNYLPIYLGIPATNYEVRYRSGAGFGNGLFESDCLDIATIPSTENVHIIIGGGFNDGSYLLNNSISDLETAFSNFYNAAKTKYPKSTIHVAFLAFETPQIASDRNNRDALDMALREYKTLPQFGMYYLKDCEYALRDLSLLDASGFHPTNDGGKMIASSMANAIMSGVGIVYDKLRNCTITSSIGTIDNTSYWREFTHDNIASVSFYFSISSASFNLTTNYQEIASITNPIFAGTSKCVTPIRFTYRDSGGTHVDMAILKYENGKIYVRGNTNASGITIIEIVEQSFTVPSNWIW